MEECIKDISCYEFYCRSEDDAHSKCDKKIIRTYNVEYKKNGRHAESVDRADGTVQKSSVHDLAECHSMVDNFCYPTDKRIYQEETAGIEE